MVKFAKSLSVAAVSFTLGFAVVGCSTQPRNESQASVSGGGEKCRDEMMNYKMREDKKNDEKM
ncbi:MAG: hypothetical protein KDA36_08015, partial [Planctomycetaceae bacterium]|nr:hypothetical protein [Planctomycetaceae bacterium]